MPTDWNLRRLEPGEVRPEFDCGDADLNEFFAIDSVVSGEQLMSVTYVAENEQGNVVAYFSVLNDAIKKEDIPGSSHRRLIKRLPKEKRYKNLPAVKIGRLATCADSQGKGYGTSILDFVKAWFVIKNKTGCRFIVVDANNNERTIRFYTRNGFNFITSKDEKEDTRTMYFDLITFRS